MASVTDLVSTSGGEVATLAEAPATFVVGDDYYVYLGDSGDSTDPSCYSGVPGQGYACRSTDGETIVFVCPEFAAAGAKLVSVYDSLGALVSSTAVMMVLRRSFSNSLYEMRGSWPDWYGVGPRDQMLETDE